MNTIEGRVWKFGDSIDTDLIVPGQYLDAPVDEAAKHALESIRPDFAREVRNGDILVAGKNFGCGSSRENAPIVLQKLGVGCIVAESFARIFFRNAIAIGLPLVTCKGAAGIFSEGETARVEFREARVQNPKSGAALQGEPLSGDILAIVEKGGILELLKSARKP